MADNGKLYPAFDGAYVAGMKTLCAEADILLPNITEACFLTGVEYKETYDRAYIDKLLSELRKISKASIVLTGVGYQPGKTGVVVFSDKYEYYEHNKISKSSHGTGDVYASAFVGAFMNDISLFNSAKIAADYTYKCIEKTVDDSSHWYGVKFELVLPDLIKTIYTCN